MQSFPNFHLHPLLLAGRATQPRGFQTGSSHLLLRQLQDLWILPIVVVLAALHQTLKVVLKTLLEIIAVQKMKAQETAWFATNAVIVFNSSCFQWFVQLTGFRLLHLQLVKSGWKTAQLSSFLDCLCLTLMARSGLSTLLPLLHRKLAETLFWTRWLVFQVDRAQPLPLQLNLHE